MTFVIAKVTDPDAGKVTLFSDTKITDQNDSTFNRQTLSNPGQKVVIVDDDVVIGFAGHTPASAVNRVAELRGQSADRDRKRVAVPFRGNELNGRGFEELP